MENEKKPKNDFVSLYLETLPFTKDDEQIFQEISKNYSKILIFGGLGFIGKNFFEYINKLDIFSQIIIVDKSLPEISYIPSHKLHEYLKNPKVKFYQIDICAEKHVRKIFEEHPNIDIVVNLASETRLSFSDEDYHNRCYKLPILCGNLSAEYQVKKFVQISCCKVYKSSSYKIKENSDIEPWDIRYQNLSEAEKQLKSIPKLNYIILRAACVYGPYDLNGETILRIANFCIYKVLNEKMKVMWDGSLKMNTINALDVSRAILYSIQYCNKEVFNIVDENDTDQNKIHKVLKEIFNINVECVGSVRSFFLKLTLDKVIQMMNEKHLQTWFGLCLKYNMLNSPVNVVIYRENLLNNNLYIDGDSFKKRTGFKCLIPLFDIKYFKALVSDYIENGLLPPIL